MHIVKIAQYFNRIENWNWKPGTAAVFNVEDDEKFYIQDSASVLFRMSSSLRVIWYI